MVRVSPIARLVMAATLMLVARAAEAAASVVAVPAVPTAVMVRDSRAPAVSMRICWPTTKP